MTDVWRSRLSEYLDGELSGEEALALQAHLGTCSACRAEIEGLQAVLARIESAPDRQPETDLWPRIARRMEAGRMPAELPPPPRRGLALGRLAAAVAAVAVGAAAWLWSSRAPVGTGVDGGAPFAVLSSEGAERYSDAAAAWKELMSERPLPADVSDALAEEMAAFERAVAETRAALAEDPSDPGLRAHLAETLRAQVRFLSRVEQMVGDMS